MNSHPARRPRRQSSQRLQAPTSPGRSRGGVHPLTLLLAMALGLGGGLALSRPLADLVTERTRGEAKPFSNPFAAWSGGLGRQDLLVLGTDVGGGNTDVMAVLHIDDGVTRITQIPRDTYIEAETYGPIKINSLYSLGGSEAVKREVAHRLGRPIQHHLVVNLAGIRRMADLLGGIEVEVPKRMVYVDNSQGLRIDLQPGRQTLRGRDLEGFLRFRHDETGDLGRMERQQLALKALFHKLTQPQNLVRLPALLVAAGHDLRTDLGPMELGGLITAMGSTDLETQRLDGRPLDIGGISYWDADWGSAEASAPRQPQASQPEPRYRFLF